MKLVKKKYFYGKASRNYLDFSAGLSKRDLIAIQAKALWRNRVLALKQPAAYLAAWALRAIEGLALLAGLIVARTGSRPAHRRSQGKGKQRQRVLLLSPTTVYGSWGWFAELIAGSPSEWSWTVVTYGRPRGYGARNVRFIGPKRGNYVRFGRFLYRHQRLAPLNALWYLPLIPLLIWCRFIGRPRLVVTNGILAAATAEISMGNVPVVLVHHVYLGYIVGKTRSLAGYSIRRADAVLANSEGGADDVKAIASQDIDNLVVVPMWASEEFFSVPLRLPTSDRPVVAYVGRCDPDKCAQAFRVCGQMAEAKEIDFIVVGTGELLNTLPTTDGIVRAGYIESRHELAKIMAGVDLVWAPADTTYLSRPAWEGLAAGARVIITNHPPAGAKVDAGIRISQDVIPEEFGIVVDGDNDSDVLKYLRSVDVSGCSQRSLGLRERSRSYARTNAGPEKRDVAISALAKFMGDEIN